MQTQSISGIFPNALGYMQFVIKQIALNYNKQYPSLRHLASAVQLNFQFRHYIKH